MLATNLSYAPTFVLGIIIVVLCAAGFWAPKKGGSNDNSTPRRTR